MGARMRLDITPHPEVWLEPDRLFERIALIGYRARRNEVRLTAVGRVQRSGDRLQMAWEGAAPGPRQLRLVPEAGKDAGRTADALAALSDRRAEVEGWWRPAEATGPTAPPTLEVTRVRALGSDD